MLRQFAIEGRMKKEGMEKGRGGARTDIRARYGLHKVVRISRQSFEQVRRGLLLDALGK